MKVGEFKKQLIAEIKQLLKEAISISRNELVQKIKDTKGDFFTVTFIKKDGSTRVMNARFGVKKYLKGGELPYDPISKGLLPVYDVKVEDYRMININTIISAKVGGEEYMVS
jgi:hypothetical protein